MENEQNWVSTNTRSLSTSQLAGVVNAILDHLRLGVEHRVENGVVAFRLVNRTPPRTPAPEKNQPPEELKPLVETINRAFAEGKDRNER